jgi:hypothetical protein
LKNNPSGATLRSAVVDIKILLAADDPAYAGQELANESEQVKES